MKSLELNCRLHDIALVEIFPTDEAIKIVFTTDRVIDRFLYREEESESYLKLIGWLGNYFGEKEVAEILSLIRFSDAD